MTSYAMITQFLSEKQIGYRFHRTVISLASVPIKKKLLQTFSVDHDEEY